MENCELCGRQQSVNDMWSVSGIKKTYECKDEAACRKLAAEHRALKAAKAKAERTVSFKEKFGVELCELVELSPRLRDASIHYYDKVGDRIFTQALWDQDGEMKINTNPQLRAVYGLN